MEVIHKKYGKYNIFLVHFILKEVQNHATVSRRLEYYFPSIIIRLLKHDLYVENILNSSKKIL